MVYVSDPRETPFRITGATVNSPTKRRSLLLAVAGVFLAVVVVAVINRDAIADRILRGSDTTLTGEEAQISPQAGLAVELIGALRAADTAAISRLATIEQIARVQQETTQSSPESAASWTEMLADLPADDSELRGAIKSVQTHEDRAVVLFETRANSWFVQLTQTTGGWKVSGF
jgi:hypothetical protein